MIEIAWSNFTPWSALLGGILVGIAAASFLLLNGRIAGISGILGGLLAPAKGDIAWRLAFLLGLIGAPAVWVLATELPPIEIEAGYPALIIAGLLVGIGWGIAGFCPGPGLVALGAGEIKAAVFVAAMVAGMGIFEVIERSRAKA
ncbi:YeeE/YedE family protein [Marinobacter salsuginis]|uniref:Membrane protein n=1 Tax=Marinobacter salsuginis TaxID=418719 RepID=A0A5M3Q416_9GAMM|nr:DUF6691 family protein [Marinobacter salsuginis]GBO89390.1 membrane protein [Marinobacter salsuginis]